MVMLALGMGLGSNAQDVTIALEPFVLEIPDVQSLKVRPLGALVPRVNPQDSTQTDYFLPVYYELIRADGRAVETRNAEIPEQFADLLVKYQKGQLSAGERLVVNAYLNSFNALMRLKEE